MEEQILDDTFQRDPIRFPRDQRYRVRAFRYLMYAFILAFVRAYLNMSYYLNTNEPITETGVIAAKVAQIIYIIAGIYFITKSIKAKEPNDAFKIGSILGFGLLIFQMGYYLFSQL